MKFPKQELDIDAYLLKVKELLNDSSCHIFIDTNVISQLYRLNEDARNDFYSWVSSCSDRFHIPNWSVHEYSNRVNTQNTKDYLSELTKAKTCSKELNNISRFIKGYVGDSLLTGSVYAGEKAQLIQDIDLVISTFEKIANAININLTEHQQNVHKEVLDKLNSFIIDSNIYSIMENLVFEHDVRFDGKIPPGFKDSDKGSNRIGDLIIWKEILDFCKRKNLKNDNAKVVFISRDMKPDMVYRPIKQIRGGNSMLEEDKIGIAHESLVYEFKLATKSDDFYSISFYTLVQLLASNYRELATSFQIATIQENTQTILEDPTCIDSDEMIVGNEVPDVGNILDSVEEQSPQIEDPGNLKTYSDVALADSNYETIEGLASINECIENLKTHNWYKQNPAIEKLGTLSFIRTENTQPNRDSFFVLGRNVLQSAEGTAGSAMHFLDNLHSSISNWPEPFQQAFVDGCLYEVFFDSFGKIRAKTFKSLYFETVVNEIKKMPLTNAFDFIKKELQEKNAGRFVPEVNSDKKYKFEFSFGEKGDLNYAKTLSLKINDIDVSETFEMHFERTFCDSENIINSLSSYYAIPMGNIELIQLPEDVKVVNFIAEKHINDLF